MSARKDYPFPAAVADGRVDGGAYGQQECARALDEIDALRIDAAYATDIARSRGDENERLRTVLRKVAERDGFTVAELIEAMT